MANRTITDWTDSVEHNKLSVEAERLYVRLITKVDDYGCYTSNAGLIRAALFPLHLELIAEQHMTKWLCEIKDAGLLMNYEVEGKWYLQLTDFKQTGRRKSKYPLPPEAELTVTQSQKEPVGPLTEDQQAFANFQKWLKDNAVEVARMSEPFTMDQFLKLRTEVGSSIIRNLCLEMHNWKELNKKNKSAYLTFVKWNNRAATRQ